ncbi:MAG: AmmeMemoRadiSam system radical SAM enzyme [Clostridia bacterium]|jgi:pyruvate formate lyase activating enzyme|nr:AmmeMemoRadiSam system radical SAM enzyme [Clostridia bacterium]
MKTVCRLCPHECELESGQTGFCNARANVDGSIKCTNYGRLTSIALDPIEKKPLLHFYPGKNILSVGSFGCNLRCPFCQNYSISMAKAETTYVSPEKLIDTAESLTDTHNNIGIAFTYNEPLISYEYVLDCCTLAHDKGLKTVLVTNGMILEKPLLNLLPYVDAMNIDLKGFSQSFYSWIDGDFETVKNTIAVSVKHCHVEITTLIIPGKNDSECDMNSEAQWIASLNTEIPLHITRFFPRYKLRNTAATPVEKIYSLCDTAKRYLKHVYPGNC